MKVLGNEQAAKQMDGSEELVVNKQTQMLMMPVAARRQLNDLPDELWTKINIEFCKDASDAIFNSLVE